MYDDAAAPNDPAIESWSVEASRWRLDRLRPSLPFSVETDVPFIGGNSNDAWLLDDAVLRVCWRCDRDRLLREAAVLDAMPAEIPRARVLERGRTDDMSWLLLERCKGEALHHAHAPDDPIYRRAFAELAELLKALHSWLPPADLVALLEGAGSDQPPAQRQLVVDDIPALLSIADAATRLAFVDDRLVARAVERVLALAPALATAPLSSVVHGDVASGNVMIADGRITAIIDFEWTRMGSPELDFVTQSFLAEQFPMLRPSLGWLAADYPSLVSHDGFEERLWLYHLAFILRGILWWPPDAPEGELEQGHHLRSLRILVDRPFARHLEP